MRKLTMFRNGMFSVVSFLFVAFEFVRGDVLIDAVKKGNITEMEQLLKYPDLDLEAITVPDTTPLFLALKAKKITISKMLMQRGADVNVLHLHRSSNKVVSPLHLAVINKMRSCVSMLLQCKARVNGRDSAENTALHYAVVTPEESIIKLLLESGADIKAQGQYRYTPLHMAAKDGLPSVVELLIDAGADMEATDNYGDAPLHLAVRNKNEGVVDVFIKKGAYVNRRNNERRTPLHMSICQWPPRIKATTSLLKAGADLNVLDYQLETALHMACGYMAGDIDTVQLLLQNGALMNLKNIRGQTPLFLATVNPYMNKIPIFLIDAGADICDLNSVHTNNLVRRFWPKTYETMNAETCTFSTFDEYVTELIHVNIPNLRDFRFVNTLRKAYEKLNAFALYRVLKCQWNSKACREEAASVTTSLLERLKFVVFDELLHMLSDRTYMSKAPGEIYHDILYYHGYYGMKLENAAWNLSLASHFLKLPRKYLTSVNFYCV